MEELKNELKALLIKHNAFIFVEQPQEDSFLCLCLKQDVEGEIKSETIDLGYGELIINQFNL